MPALRLWLAAFLAVALMTGTASAETKVFKATLSASSEVPPNDSKGTGTATVRLNTATKKITWSVTHKGLTGPVKAGHIHGPADPGANAGVAIPFAGSMKSPIRGSATVTDAQIADLEAGKDYVNLHTDANKGGELRGQLEAAK